MDFWLVERMHASEASRKKGRLCGRGKPRPYIRYIGAAQMEYDRRRHFENESPLSLRDIPPFP